MEKMHVGGTGRSTRWYAHPPAKIWQALIQNAELGEGGPILPCLPAAGSTASAARITLYKSKKTLECAWGGGLLRWDLEARNGKTLVHFTHSCNQSESEPWLACLDSLAAGAAL